ncbi:MAG TPA: universal stress protein [Stellaceae bacterium]|nr:universal stress protein [Stellaceae bacterium]
MPESGSSRVLLAVVDETPEHRAAVRYAARRAAHTGGRLAMLYVIEPTEAEVQQFIAMEELAQAERREAAEQALQALCEEIAPLAGSMPILYIRKGRRHDALLALIAEEPTISILVLAAGTGPGGPGPLVSHLTGKAAPRLRIPITIVPGGLSREEIDALS